ncbi:MAG: hypothetical protein EOM52_04095 [Clostridia bacterium]|nr:hypothetical protein [Clostridia bacterium]
MDFYTNLLSSQSDYMKAQCPVYRYYLQQRVLLQNEIAAVSVHLEEALRDYQSAARNSAYLLYDCSFRRGLELYDSVRRGMRLKAEDLLDRSEFRGEFLRCGAAMAETFAELEDMIEIECFSESARFFAAQLGEIHAAIFDIESRFFCLFGYHSRVELLKWESLEFTRWLEKNLLPDRNTI